MRILTLHMLKRSRSPSPACGRVASMTSSSPSKKTKVGTKFTPNKIASHDNAKRADTSPPIFALMDALKLKVNNLPKGDAVVYWMRMEDMRISDNRALSQACQLAQKSGIPVIVLFILSPQDYKAHDRGARRIDFCLRNLSAIKTALAKLNIPLFTTSHSPRATIPSHILSLLAEWKATHLFANIEYEVDELRRDINVCKLAHSEGKQAIFIHDKCIVEPGMVKTKEGRGYTVYSPFLRAWLPHVTTDGVSPLDCAPAPIANSPVVHEHAIYGKLFNVPIPESVPGFELDGKDSEQMRICWAAGEDIAREMLHRFLYTKARTSQLGAVDPLAEGAKAPEKSNSKESRIGKYNYARDSVNADTTSRLSPYLASGIISARECIRATLELSDNKTKKLDASRDTGVGRWVQEVAWRDFYTHILAFYPRVSMGRPFLEKFSSIQWETNEAHLQAWKDGRTGVPIVDAAMRQARTMGWMHNRVRMITAMWLVKDLMIDWQLGEKYFMEVLVDGDLASNNGGWQWSASTGVDAAPYFRIFNPYTQSLKADPTGEYIRYFVPELAEVKGNDIHRPSAALANKLGYPRPLVEHSEVRERALRRYKNPGEA